MCVKMYFFLHLLCSTLLHFNQMLYVGCYEVHVTYSEFASELRGFLFSIIC